jgi:hypothetical protein
MNYLIRHLLDFLVYGATLFAAAAPTVGAPSGGGEPGAFAPSGGAPAAPPSGGTPPAPQQVNWDSAPQQLRDAYQTTKRSLDDLQQKYQPWQQLNVKPEDIGQFQGVYNKVFQEAGAIGRGLGYPDAEIIEALREDPVRTIDFLRNEAARMEQGGQERGGQEDLGDLVAQHVQQAISPIQERENLRATNEANSLFERTVHQMAVDTFKAEGVDVAQIPQDEMFMLASATSEILKYNEDALRGLKYEGKTAPIQQAFQEARTMLDKYYLARAGRDRARVQPPQRGGFPPQPGQPAKKPTLDEIINDPSVINEKYR